MQVHSTTIPEVLVFEPRVFEDERGFFFESFNETEMQRLGIRQHFVQDNHSRSTKHVLRGLHYQIQQPQGKLIRVVTGCVFDVAVDIRRSSPTFGKWVGVHLSGENRRMLWVPPGFAHGFQVLSDFADFLYKTTNFYAPEHERTISWQDTQLGIQWPLTGGAIVSPKDRNGLPLSLAETFE
jgi:dTDP-4-dehydrorhamnose 3,5-epimerase